MTSPAFASYARNGEDVVLWRALGSLPNGRYLEIGGPDPGGWSTSRAFYDRGWRGVAVEPEPACAERHRAQRPGDLVVQATRTDTDGWLDAVLDGAGWSGPDLHFVTVGGTAASARPGLDLRRRRPWVLVIGSPGPAANRPSQSLWTDLAGAADYQFCLFDGISRYFVAAEHAATLGPALSYPACAADHYSRPADRELERQRDELQQQLDRTTGELIRWRTAALTQATGGSGRRVDTTSELALLQRELTAIRRTVSWRVTRPLRSLRSVTSARRPE
jgi:hypothetical protein